MKLIACQDCHAQYDITTLAPGSPFDCRCGSALEATAPVGHDAAIQRCSACGAVAKDGVDDCEYCGAGIVHKPTRGSLICPECMARNLPDARFCLACGIGFEPQIIANGEPELRCPCCDCWMTAHEVGGLVVQECGKCNGLWSAAAVFGALIDRATATARDRMSSGLVEQPRVVGDNPATSKVVYRRCPECDVLMGRRNFRKRSGVILDECSEHGVWLDANELERIAGFVLSGRAEAAARMDATEQSRREKSEARAAALRVQMGSIGQSSEPSSIWGSDSRSTGLDSIVSLLRAFFD